MGTEKQEDKIKFENTIKIRMSDEITDAINTVLITKSNKYSSTSHFIRCGILKLLRKENESFNQKFEAKKK